MRKNQVEKAPVMPALTQHYKFGAEIFMLGCDFRPLERNQKK